MVKNVLFFAIITFFFLINTPAVLAERGVGDNCGPSYPANPGEACVSGYSCQLESAVTGSYGCLKDTVGDVFGKITPPDPIKNFAGSDSTGAGGLSKFLSNFIALIYAIATVVLVLMLVWGAWDWVTSEGEKEKIDAARKKIINAIIGIVLFAATFAVIQVLGQFTGFTFFTS